MHRSARAVARPLLPPAPPHPRLRQRTIQPLHLLLLSVLALLLLLPLLHPRTVAAGASRRPPPKGLASPYYDDPLLDAIIQLAQVPNAVAADLPAAAFTASSLSHSHSRSHSLIKQQQKGLEHQPQEGPQPQQQHQGAKQQQEQQPRQQQQQPQTFPSDDDFVFVTGTCRERMPLAKSTRAWRRGMRAFLLTDQDQADVLERLNAEGAAHNESLAFFPDDGDERLGRLVHGTKPGDARAAVAPFAAHRHFGETYKWMLYGDDDTLFFTEPLKRMLTAFDPDTPLAFSDSLWYFGQQPNAHSPRCLPCHMAGEGLPSLRELATTPHVREHIRRWLKMRSINVTEDDVEAVVREGREVPGRLFVPAAACPVCTPRAACKREAAEGEGEGPFKAACNPSVAHGGAGMVFSVGLLRSIPYRDAMACVRGHHAATGGDAIVSYCLWRHGVAFTDPGPLVRHMYDPHYHVFGGKADLGYLFDPIGSMSHGKCGSKCRWMLRNTLSLHIKGRHFRTWRIGSMMMWGIAHATQAAQSFLDLTSRDGGASWRQMPYGYDVDDTANFAPYLAAAESASDAAVAAAEGVVMEGREDQ